MQNVEQHRCICSSMDMHPCGVIYTYIYIYIYVYIYVYMYVHVYTYIHVYIHVYTYVYICIYSACVLYIHVRIRRYTKAAEWSGSGMKRLRKLATHPSIFNSAMDWINAFLVYADTIELLLFDTYLQHTLSRFWKYVPIRGNILYPRIVFRALSRHTIFVTIEQLYASSIR